MKYRLRTSDPWSVVKPQARARLEDALRHAVEDILARGRELGAEGYDLWEYLHLHNLSRHYSFPMMSSLRTFAECRSPGLENGLFDLAIAMSADQKVNGTAYQQAITRLNPAVMAVRNANTNLTARDSLRRQTWTKVAQVLGHRLLGLPYAQSPGWRDRSWPSAAAALAASPALLVRLDQLGRSDRLESLGFLDMSAVGATAKAHLDREQDHAVLLNLLMTIEGAIAR